MDGDCVFFPELYRLWDREADGGGYITEDELRRLVDLCTMCGLCPCPAVPGGVMEAKSRYIDHEGLPLSNRLLADVPRLASLCRSFPAICSLLQVNSVASGLLRRFARIHPDRQLPEFPKEDFFQWAHQKGLSDRKPGARIVAYFSGCTAGYLFPQVGRAFVEVMEHNGQTVYVPPQGCCGMPQFAEGDRDGALSRTRANLESLLPSVQAGDVLVTSCPTCGYYMKVLLNGHKKTRSRAHQGDDGYFSPLEQSDRIELAGCLSDAGEFLMRLHGEGRFDTRFAPLHDRMVYFAPCHQREQNMGRPYLELLSRVPGLVVDTVGDAECCGMGGNFGFKADFHAKSLAIGNPLMAKIRERAPKAIVTECISCRLQFLHSLPYPVFHPLEILAKAYQSV